MPTDTAKWDELQEAQHHLFEAAKYALQAMTLHGQGHFFQSYEKLSREQFEEAAKALGYKLVKAEAPAEDALDVFVNRINAIALGGRS